MKIQDCRIGQEVVDRNDSQEVVGTIVGLNCDLVDGLLNSTTIIVRVKYDGCDHPVGFEAGELITELEVKRDWVVRVHYDSGDVRYVVIKNCKRCLVDQWALHEAKDQFGWLEEKVIVAKVVRKSDTMPGLFD